MQGVYQTISPHRCPIPKFHFGHGLGIVREYQIKFSQPICMLFVKPCFDRGVASAFKYLFLTIVSVSLAGCAGTSSPSHSTARLDGGTPTKLTQHPQIALNGSGR
jgi:hypothetical protein